MAIEITGDQGEKFNPPLYGIELINSAGIDVLITVNSSDPEHALRLRPGESFKLIEPVHEYRAWIDKEALARKNKEHELLMRLSPTYRAMKVDKEPRMFEDLNLVDTVRVDLANGISNEETIELGSASRNVNSIPEFPTVALPIASVLGLVYMVRKKK